jgi:hypothetical protein
VICGLRKSILRKLGTPDRRRGLARRVYLCGRGAAGAQVVNEVVDWLVLLRCSAYGAGGAAAS